jgi:hypothetical protein
MFLWLAVACAPDYGLNGKKDPGNGGDDTDGVHDSGTSTGEPDACDDAEYPGRDVPLNEECDVELSTGGFDPVVEWSYGTGSFCGPAAVGPLRDTNSSGAIDKDDRAFVVIYNASSRVVAIKGDGTEAWKSANTYGHDGGLAIGDLDGDGWPEVVTADSDRVCALRGNDGSEAWCHAGLSASLDPYGYSYPAIADMDGDGVPEVTVGNVILDGPSGALVGKGDYGIGSAPYGGVDTGYGGSYGALSVPIDLDGDGKLELVTGNAAYRRNGNAKWTNGGLDGLVAVADFDGDGQGEIVKTSGIYVTGMETDGSEVWGPIAYSGNLGAPAADDLDGDGIPEIVFAAQNSLIAMKWGGKVMWKAPISDSSGAAGPTLFDFEGDGYPEVLFADETTIRFFSGLDGTVKYTSDKHASYTILETPVVADVDSDGQVEIVLGHCQGNAEIGAVTVYGDKNHTWPPGRKIWNQHAYSITNVTDVGGIPAATPSNWPTYNSFRSGDVGRPPGEFYDVQAEVLGVCEDECDTGKVLVDARVVNAGNLPVPAGIPVVLRAGDAGPVVAEATTTKGIESGKSGETLHFVADAADMAGTVPTVIVDQKADGTGIVYECDESNNVNTWTDAVCQ